MNARLSKYPALRRCLKAFHVLPDWLLDIPWPSDIVVHNVKKALPFPENSLRAVYASHLLEHLYLDEGKRLLRECYRILSPGGILRIVVPDAAKQLEAIRQANSELCSVPDPHAPPRNLFIRIWKVLRNHDHQSGNIFQMVCGSVKNFESHKQLYDAKALIFYLREAGFVGVEEMGAHRSRIEGIERIETFERASFGAVCVEGVKPERSAA